MHWRGVFTLGGLRGQKSPRRRRQKASLAQIGSSLTPICPSWIFRMSTLFFMQRNPGKSREISHWLEKAWRRPWLNKHFFKAKYRPFIFWQQFSSFSLAARATVMKIESGAMKTVALFFFLCFVRESHGKPFFLSVKNSQTRIFHPLLSGFVLLIRRPSAPTFPPHFWYSWLSYP